MSDITFNGMTMEFSVVENMMDDELKQEVMQSLENYSEQELLDAYMSAHQQKFGSAFFEF